MAQGEAAQRVVELEVRAIGFHEWRPRPDEMKLAIIAYPSLDESDRKWIELFRAKRDPHARLIDVHFTLVFPVETEPGELEPDMTAAAQSTQPISFEIRRTQVVRDVLGNVSHIFLVPEEGGVEITTLHDRLYAGVLKGHLRSDIPFVPHMTVGAAPNSETAERLAEGLDAQFRIVRGTVSNIELVNVGLPRVQSIATYALGNSNP